MADALVVTIFAYLHIVSAMGWLGGAVLFLSVVAPGLRKISPRASLEFLAKVGPNATRFFIATATSTIVFGLILFYVSGVRDIPVYVGALLGLTAYLDALLVTVPAFNKADRMAEQMLASPQAGPPPPEFTSALKKGGMGATITAVLLVVAAVFMVVSGFMY